MVFAHVIYKKTGAERKNVTVKAYNLLKNQYTLLGYVDENGDPVEGPQEQVRTTVQKKRSQDAAPAVNEIRKKMSPEEIEAKKAELQEMNRAAIQKALDEQALKEGEKVLIKNVQPEEFNGPHQVGPEVKERKKPGPKPKQNA